jgi:ubiquinone/menaquinone biosynthesis C-methylase UbiE
MPVDYTFRDRNVLYQRKQYEKGGPGKLYWDYRDKSILQNIEKDSNVILDLGCGEGITLEKLLKAYPYKDIRGIDITKENVEICRKYNLPVREGNILDLDIPDASIDCCILSEVIEHIEECDLAFSGIKRILKKGGKLIIIFPNDFVFKCVRLLTFKFREAFYEVGHLHKFTPRDIKVRLECLGFKIIKIKNIPFFFWGLSLHCLIVARK